MPEEHWESIDEMPLHNWMKCSNGEINYVWKIPGSAIQDGDAEKWMNLYDQYIKKYGLTKMYQRMLKVMKDKAILECDFVMTKDRFKLNLIEIEEQRLKDMMANGGEGMSMDESLVHLSKWLGYRLNPKQITVVEYFNTLKQYGKENKQTGHKR